MKATRRVLMQARNTLEGWRIWNAEAKDYEPQDTTPYSSGPSCFAAITALWPSESVWQGRQVAKGWSIVVDN